MNSAAKSQSGGYAGLAILLITVAIVALLSALLMRRTLAPVPRGVSDISTSTDNAIRAAEEAKRLIENRNSPPIQPGEGI